MLDLVFKHLDEKSLPKVREAIALSQWPNGMKMSKEEKAECLERLLLWEEQNLPEEKRTGYMPTKCASLSGKTDTSILRFKD